MFKFETSTNQTLKSSKTKVYYPLSVIVIIILISAGIIFSSGIFYNGIETRVEALRGSASMLNSTISDPSDQRAGVDYWISRGLNYSQLLNNEIMLASTFSDVNQSNFNTLQRYLQGYTYQCKDLSDLAYSTAKSLAEQENSLRDKGIDSPGTSFEAIYAITVRLANTTQQMKVAFIELTDAAKVAQTGGETEMNTLREKGIELTNRYFQAHALVNAAIATLPAGDVNILAPVLLITVLYAVFLMLPWVLLLLFFLRKRSRLVEAKMKFSIRLNLTGTGDIEKQAFRLSEYIVSALLLTAIDATLFYFFFYPHASSGLAQLVSSGGGVSSFSNYLVASATPITFGFIGAYFFVLQMLLRRYFADDLNPSAYNYAIVRILTVFILSVIFQMASSSLTWTRFAVCAAAFVVGIFPSVGLRWILRWANSLVKGLNAPEFIDRYPLTEIDGLNTWHEARLLEENVENIQNLATAPLNDLVINTNFNSQQLVDWVDQAILLVSIRDRWSTSFQSIGIRTATDLLDNTLDNNYDNLDPIKVENLIKALNATSERTQIESGNPRCEAALKASELNKAVSTIDKMAIEADLLAQTLIAEKPETLDSVLALNKKLEGLARIAQDIKENKVKALADTRQEQLEKDKDFVSRMNSAIVNITKISEECSDKLNYVSELASFLDRKRPETLHQINTVFKDIDASCAIASGLTGQVASTIKFVLQHATLAKRPNLVKFIAKLEDIQKAALQLLKETQETRSSVTSLDKNKIETLNLIEGLKTRISQLSITTTASQIILRDASRSFDDLPLTQSKLKATKEYVDSAGNSITELLTLTTEAKDAVGYLDIDKPETMAALNNAKETITAFREAAKKVKNNGQQVSEILLELSSPAVMTKEMLSTLVMVTNQGPNIKYIKNYWKQDDM